MASTSECIKEIVRILKEDGVVFQHSTPLTNGVMGGGTDLHKNEEEIKKELKELGEDFIPDAFLIQTYYKNGEKSKEWLRVYYVLSILKEINGEGISPNMVEDLMQNYYNSIKL